MPTFYKSHSDRYRRDKQKKQNIELPGTPIEGNTLGEAIESIERITGIYIIADDPPKYFKYYETRYAKEHKLVDIHIERNGEIICPKQDLSFELMPNDILLSGELEC